MRNRYFLTVAIILILMSFSACGSKSSKSPATFTDTPTHTGTALLTQSPANSNGDTATGIVIAIQPVVVRIDATGKGFTSSGSGFIVDARGYVVTNNHVILQTSDIVITVMNGDTYNASIVTTNSNRDLAILKLTTDKTDFPIAALGSNSDVLVGEDVLAAGFPLGTDLPGPVSFSKGIVSAMRTYQGLNYIQTDVTINPGNSGGCLLDLNGKVIGITTAGLEPPNTDFENIGLAIPVDEIKSFIQSGIK